MEGARKPQMQPIPVYDAYATIGGREIRLHASNLAELEREVLRHLDENPHHRARALPHQPRRVGHMNILIAPLRLTLCRMGWHAWVEWGEASAQRCKHCLRWRAGTPPRR